MGLANLASSTASNNSIPTIVASTDGVLETEACFMPFSYFCFCCDIDQIIVYEGLKRMVVVVARVKLPAIWRPMGQEINLPPVHGQAVKA